MKKLLFTITFLACIAFAFAGPNTRTSIAAERNISISIRSQITFPEFLKEKEGEHSAAIFFRVTECGTIRIQEIKCDDDELRANLLSQAETIKVDITGLDTRDTYKVVVKFETL